MGLLSELGLAGEWNKGQLLVPIAARAGCEPRATGVHACVKPARRCVIRRSHAIVSLTITGPWAPRAPARRWSRSRERGRSPHSGRPPIATASVYAAGAVRDTVTVDALPRVGSEPVGGVQPGATSLVVRAVGALARIWSGRPLSSWRCSRAQGRARRVGGGGWADRCLCRGAVCVQRAGVHARLARAGCLDQRRRGGVRAHPGTGRRPGGAFARLSGRG
jgi:hypothetical protein